MDIDAEMRRRGEFPADQPMEALRADHAFVKELFEHYFQTHDTNEKRDCGQHILSLLDMHTTLEEVAFYPRVRVLDSDLIDYCEHEHDQATQMMKRIRLMNEGDPEADQMYRQLADAIQRHIATEEQLLFPKVEQSNVDLGAIGHEMQALETKMIADRLQKPAAPGIRL